ncbi:MAG: tRNA uridine-5-carboxymethylaminomethyl(34) synthesis GTPase MnmE, partial [Desulfobulbus sp.]|nr:tRNA uridine-5-carboxymethylaminomethyl(34) synthesis GTPase MnmE [Desulfobulbus sp.]
FASHHLYYGIVVSPDGQPLDEALAVHMHAPHTYPGEDVVELHCHGAFVVLQEVLRRVLALGARPAEQGEFTKRAFLAGRIDLTQAEAVMDLLQAQTARSARLAVNQLQGQLADMLAAIRDELVTLLALLEVAIDFPDEDVEIFQPEETAVRLHDRVVAPLERLIAMSEHGRIIREGVKVVIAGRPNVGKSSLLNALLQEERALVTALAGTTRDTIEESISIRGIPVQLVDTAGIRAHEDPLEAMGIERAQQKCREADLILFVIDARAGLTEPDQELYTMVRGQPHVVVVNKRELIAEEGWEEFTQAFPLARVVTVSARERLGLEDLEDAVCRMVLGDGSELAEQMTCAPNVRHRAILEKALAACRRFGEALGAGAPVDLLAVEVQSALDELGDLVGLITPEDVLDAIFSRFCIGK